MPHKSRPPDAISKPSYPQYFHIREHTQHKSDAIWSEAIRAHADKGAPAHEAADGKRHAVARLALVTVVHAARAARRQTGRRRYAGAPLLLPAVRCLCCLCNKLARH